MADLVDVLNVLGGSIGGVVYPSGTSQPSILGGTAQIEVVSGWPLPSKLDIALGAGNVMVSVFPREEERNVTRYPADAIDQTVNTPTVSAAINGQQITIGGAAPSPTFYAHNVSVLANNKYYLYSVQPGNSATTIATALTALIVADIAGTSNTGPVITLPAGARISAARVGTIGIQAREVKRQAKLFQITVWAPTPAIRDALAGPIDIYLADLRRIAMPDGFWAGIEYRNTFMIDDLQKANCYRRDLFYTIEFATTQQVTATQVTQLTETATPTNAPTTPFITINQ